MYKPLCCVLAVLSSTLVAAAQGTNGTGYHNDSSLADALRKLAADHGDACRLSTFGTSRQGRDLWLLELGRGADRDQRTALAIVAGIDGDFPVGSAVALRVAEGLLSAAPDEPGHKLLSEHTVYILPRVNPDAAESYFATPRVEQRLALRPTDDDRDGAIDEDGPEDLNGDGVITVMRVKLEGRRIGDLQATHLPDPDEPRLLKKADRAKGETPIYAVLTEGIDNDDDEVWNEDGPGGVDLNGNFSHGYKDHQPVTGPYQVSEPESRALVDFFLNHSRIALAIFYGRHDNIATAPKGGKKGADKKPEGSQASRRFSRPKLLKGLHKDDIDLYKQVSKDYTEMTSIKKAPSESPDGAAFAWVYAEYGIPSFACRVWTRPELEKPKDEDQDNKDKGETENEEDPPAADVEDKEPIDEDGEEAPSESLADSDKDTDNAKDDMKGGKKKGKGKGKDKSPNVEDIAWLKYSDKSRDGAGFVEWSAFDHPQLGLVEIGGFVPFFRSTPPAEELDGLAEKQLKFVEYLGERFPNPLLAPVEVTQLSETVYEIRTALVNDGYFPTGLGAATLNRRVRPIVIRLDIPLERIVGGDRVAKIWSVPGSGGRHELRWVVYGEAGSVVTVKLTSEKFGDRTVDVTLAGTE
ncbi:MAG: hypothetical protein IIB58_11185 [Planctomycetes bacterium]|nr:hypothetical protein [Planctomycetota bacterium]